MSTSETPTPLIPPEAISPPPEYPTRRTLARWLLIAVAMFGVGWLLWAALPAMIPFILGLILAYLLEPAVTLLDRFLPRWAAIVIILLLVLGAIIAFFAFLVPPIVAQLVQLYTNLPSIDELQTSFEKLTAWYNANIPDTIKEPLDAAINDTIAKLQANIAAYLQTVATFLLNQTVQLISLITFLVGFLVIPFWLFFVLIDETAGVRFLNRALHPRIRSDFWNLWRLVDGNFSSWLRGQLLLGAAVGISVGIGLVILELVGFKVPYILLLAIVAGITELIPYIGPILGAIPALIVAFFGSAAPIPTTIAVLIVYVVVQQLENNLLVPRIVGESVGVHPAILTVLLIALGYVFGLVGVILAPPLAAISRDIFLYLYYRLDGKDADLAYGQVMQSKSGIRAERAKSRVEAKE